MGRRVPTYCGMLMARHALVCLIPAALVYRSPIAPLLPRLGETMTGVRLRRVPVHRLRTVVTLSVENMWLGPFGRLVSTMSIGSLGGALSRVVGGTQMVVACVWNLEVAPDTLIEQIPLRVVVGGSPLLSILCSYLLMARAFPRTRDASSGRHDEQLTSELTARHLLQTELTWSVAEISMNGTSIVVTRCCVCWVRMTAAISSFNSV